MGLQQKMVGAYINIVVTSTPNPANGTLFLHEPAPGSQPVSTNTTASATGGTGSYTYSWAYLSGDATISATGSTTNPAIGWTATVIKDETKTAVWRCSVSDGVTVGTADVQVNLTYTTDK